jgi:hypothetical protein
MESARDAVIGALAARAANYAIDQFGNAIVSPARKRLRGSHNLNPETNDDNNAMSITSNQTLSTITASSQASQRALQKGAAKVVVTNNKKILF